MTGGGVAAEREKEEESGCNPHPEMLCWLREDEMSVQELLQRVQCVITHVGMWLHFSSFPLIFTLSDAATYCRGPFVFKGISSVRNVRIPSTL